MPVQAEFQQRLESIDQLLRAVEGAADPSLRGSIKELVQLVMDLHGAGLERVLDLTRAGGPTGDGLIQKFSGDDLIGSLLILHGLHPLSLEARVEKALEKARARLRPRQGEVELLSIQAGAVRLRLRASGEGCGSTAEALKELVENAVYEAAPDVAELVIEGTGGKQGFVQIGMMQDLAIPVASNGHSGAGEKASL